MKRKHLLLFGAIFVVVAAILVFFRFALINRANRFLNDYEVCHSKLMQLKEPEEGMSRLFFLLQEDRFEEIPRIVSCSKEIGLISPRFDEISFDNLHRFEADLYQFDGVQLNTIFTSNPVTNTIVVVYDKKHSSEPIYAYILITSTRGVGYLPLNASFETYKSEVEKLDWLHDNL